MRKLTIYEINTIEFGKILTSMKIEGEGDEGKTYQFVLELQRVTFKCDKDFIGDYNYSDGNQGGYAITLKKDNLTDYAIFITECFEPEAFTVLGAYAGSVYMCNRLTDSFIRDYTNIHL